MKVCELTPVQQIAGMYFKREDLYTPFGTGGVNGGKLRQCMLLVETALKQQHDKKGILTYCSIHSPQAPITAAVAKYFGLPCVIAYGGTNTISIATESMPRLAMHYGANIEIVSKSGRHNVLKQKAKELSIAKELFVVQYGINIDDYGEILLRAVAEQVQNIPDNLNDIYITCGSGITTSGVIIGIEKYHKKVNHIHVISTAFDRQQKIKTTLKRLGVSREFIYHDLFHTKVFVYEKKQKLIVGGVKLHPQYEAKSMKYLIDHHLNTKNALFWIVGAEPKQI